MIEWLVRIALLLVCIGLFVWAWRQTKSQDEIEKELLDHVERQLYKDDADE